MDNTIYITGDPGFKPALLAKLGNPWMRSAIDFDDNTMSFSIPENFLFEDLKEAIGDDITTQYNLLFLDEQPDKPREAPWKFIPGNPIKMSIWSNKQYDLTR